MQKCDKCKTREYDRGAHFIEDGKVKSVYWCETCWNAEKMAKIRKRKVS